MPIRKPDKVIENRQSLGSWERKLEEDKLLLESGKVAGEVLVGFMSMIGNLGIGGAAILAAILFGKEIDDVLNWVAELWPEGGAFLSPEWIAKFGTDPLEATEEKSTATDNHVVNTIPSTADGQSFNGKSPYECYTLGASGRANEYIHSEQNIVANWLATAAPDKVAYYNQNPGKWDADIIADWYTRNPAPPTFLLLNEANHQINIRYTCAKREFAMKFLPPLASIAASQSGFQNTKPKKEPGYVKDRMLDFLAYATYPNDAVWTDDDRRKSDLGMAQINMFAFWKAPP